MATVSFSGGCARATLGVPLPPLPRGAGIPPFLRLTRYRLRGKSYFAVVKASDGESYLDMWKTAVERERQEEEFQRLAENVDRNGEEGSDDEAVAKKTQQFEKILEVPKEERDRVQRMQVIDRAAAAIAAARALLKEKPASPTEVPEVKDEAPKAEGDAGVEQGTARL